MATTKRTNSITKNHPKKPAAAETGYVFCIRNDGCPAALERHKIYRVLPDADAGRDDDLRIVDESGEDYLFPADWFIAIRARLLLPAQPALGSVALRSWQNLPAQ